MVSVEQGREILEKFQEEFPSSKELIIKILPSIYEGIKNHGNPEIRSHAEEFKGLLGFYTPTDDGRGRSSVTLSASNHRDERAFTETLRHEILGHHALNTFGKDEKRRILNSIIESKSTEGIRELWNFAKENWTEDYKAKLGGNIHSINFKLAEEVFCTFIEDSSLSLKLDPEIIKKAEKSVEVTLKGRSGFLRLDDLAALGVVIEDGFRKNMRSQQIFPLDVEKTGLFLKRESMKNQQKQPFYQQVAERLVQQLEAGTAPWQKPWSPGVQNSITPMNPTTGNPYRGINDVWLMMQGREDPRWMTYKQAEAEGFQVKKGEKGCVIEYWKLYGTEKVLDENGKPVLGPGGKPETQTVKYDRPRVFHAVVFNAEQIDGIAPLVIPKMTEKEIWEANERAENILKASGVPIIHSNQDGAFYSPINDKIRLPLKSQFDEASKYYATALHELGHATGHATRLNREGVATPSSFRTEIYAKEELRAEISSLMVGDKLGIGHDPEQHAAYVGSWIKILKDDPKEIFRAAADADKIKDYVLAFEQQQELTQENARPLDVPSQGAIDPERELLQKKRETALNNFEEAKTAYKQALAKEYGQDNVQSALTLAWHENPSVRASQSNYKAMVEEMRKHPPEEQAAPEQKHQDKTYIDVKFSEKDEVKALGAKWDVSEKSWYITSENNQEAFSRWIPSETPQAEVKTVPQNNQNDDQRLNYIAVPYSEKNEAKALGAKWDKAEKSWYIGEGANPEDFSKWKPKTLNLESNDPRKEFAEAMKTAGFIIADPHPVMDGKKHRIAVEGDKKGQISGFYVGHTDGRPAGFIQNNKTGETIRWKAQGEKLTEAQKAELAAQAAITKSTRAESLAKQQNEAAEQVQEKIKGLTEAQTPTPYMVGKGINVHPGVYAEDKNTIVPAMNIEGEIRTLQTITEDGEKRFAKNAEKTGCFHPIGGIQAVANAPVIIIAEGYATAASIAENLNVPTVAAFDSGNLKPVAEALHARFPDKPIVIAGDDDKRLEYTLGANVGRQKASEAAEAVNGKAIFPVFAPQEYAFPIGTMPVDPEAYKEHKRIENTLATKGDQITPEERQELEKGLLDDKQQATLAEMGKHSDFNDLATRSALGPDAIKRQLAPVEKIIEERKAEQVQEREPQQKRETTRKSKVSL